MRVAADDGDLLTLTEAAEHLGVHYMTAYRYVRTGRLAAHKQGTEWRVRAGDVDRLARPAPAAPIRRPRRHVDWAARVEERLVAADEAGAWTTIEAAMAAGMAPDGIYLDVLSPALRSIGDRWATGELDVADEHQASAVALRLIGRLGPRFSRRGRGRGTIVLAAPAGETHGLPIALLADLLRGRGYHVIDLGADVPRASLAATVPAQNDLMAIGLCATTSGNERSIREAIRAIRAVSDVPIVLGGAAIDGAEAARALGADLGGLPTEAELDAFSHLARRPA